MSRLDSLPTPAPGATRPHTLADRQRNSGDLTEVGLFAARVYLLIAPTIMLGALLGTSMPANVVFVMPAVAALLLTPRRVLLSMPISPAILILIAWITISYLWSIDRTETLFSIREDLAPVLGVMIVTAIVPVDESVKWLVRGFKIMLGITAIVLILRPETRVFLFEGEEELNAWVGWFGSKNQLGRSVLVAYMAFLILDRTKVSRWIAIVASIVLIIGSSSATALAGVFFVTGVWIWAKQFQRVGQDWSLTYILSSIIAGMFLLFAGFVSAAALVRVLGRDLSFSGRTEVWRPSLDFIDAEPWLGYGYRALFTGPTSESLELWREMGFQAAHSHNGPIEVALGLGVVGLGLFFVVYLATFASALRYMRNHDIAVFAFAFLLLQLLVALVEPVLLRDWLGVVVFARVMLMRVRIDDRARQVELALSPPSVELADVGARYRAGTSPPG